MKNIAVVTGTRAEYGLLRPLIEKLEQDDKLKLTLIVTGAHLEPRLGETVKEIEADGHHVDYRVTMDLHSDTEHDILYSMGREMCGLADVFEQSTPDLLILLGDRYEILMAGICALINRIPVAHIHGGELTKGLIDDGIRHSLTKISSIHFTSTEEYRRRVIQMGEQPDSVFNVGALGVENVHRIQNAQKLSREELSRKLGLNWNQPVIMVTFHPVTLEKDTSESQMKGLLTVLEKHPEYNYIFTYANADTDGHSINDLIDGFVQKHGNSKAFASMGMVGYLSTLSYTAAVVGNSSSGILEVPSFGIPTVNIGDRQGGRVHADSVIDCDPDINNIESALNKALSGEFREFCKSVKNPYDKPGTSDAIINHVKEYLQSFTTTEKDFYDLPVEEWLQKGGSHE